MKDISSIVVMTFAFFVLFPGCANKGDNQNGTLESYSQSDGAIAEIMSNPKNEDVVGDDAVQIAPGPEKPVTKYFSIWENISDIGFLSAMKDLEEIEIEGSRLLTDISPLASLSGLKRLYLSFCPNCPAHAELAEFGDIV